jgi:phosphatidylserine decarboxylase
VIIDSAGFRFVAIAAVPVVVSAIWGPMPLTIALLVLPIAIALFFRDPSRHPPDNPSLVLSPADGTVLYAGDARPDEAPAGAWRQVTIFLSLLDVHINRTPVAGRVMKVDYYPGTFVPANRPDAAHNERSEIWIQTGSAIVVTRQVVGVLARRVVCRVKAGDTLVPGARIGLMKFGSRMDVFMPPQATLAVTAGQKVRAGETVIGRLGPSAS